ncbi:MAG: hypothetical protein ACE5Q6_16735 [Dehalococcoidia bacterium]
MLGRPNAEIIARLHIAEATFFRYRRAAVSALARDLEAQEERLARRDGTAPTGQSGGLILRTIIEAQLLGAKRA